MWISGFGALVGGFLLYLLISGLGGGVDWEDRLTFDQSGELELEGIAVAYGIGLGSLVGTALGAYLALKYPGGAGAGATALLTGLAAPLVTLVALSAVPSGGSDPVLAPYAVFGGWFLSGLVTRWLVERSLKSPSEQSDRR